MAKRKRTKGQTTIYKTLHILKDTLHVSIVTWGSCNVHFICNC